MLDTILTIGLLLNGLLSIAAFGFLYEGTTMMAGEILGCAFIFFSFGLVLGMIFAAVDKYYFNR